MAVNANSQPNAFLGAGVALSPNVVVTAAHLVHGYEYSLIGIQVGYK